jgi:hypothetical protein
MWEAYRRVATPTAIRASSSSTCYGTTCWDSSGERPKPHEVKGRKHHDRTGEKHVHVSRSSLVKRG